MLFLNLIAVIFILLIVDRFRPIRFVKLHQQLGNDWSYLPIVGNAFHFIGNNEDIFKTLLNASLQSYKRKNGIISLWLGFKFLIVTDDPLQATAVLKRHSNKTFIHRLGTELIGNGTIIAPTHNKILAPTFATRHVSQFFTIFEANAKLLAEQIKSKVGKGNISCWDYICHYGLDSVCETIMDVTIGSLKELNHPVCSALKEYFKNIGNRAVKPWLHPEFLYKLLPVYKRQNRGKETIFKFIDNIIYRKKSSINTVSIPSDMLKKTTNFKTFLELLIESSEETDKSYTNEELREEVLSLTMAATDTSATAINFCILLLSQHQDIQDKVYKEIQEVVGSTDKTIEYKDLVKLNYMEAVIKETLRLYPPINLLIRDSKEDYVLPSGVTVPKNCDVAINIFGIHRNPHYWGEDANDFKPERFLSGSSLETFQTPDAYIPFGYGPRRCPGQFYAMLSMKTTIMTILRRYRLFPATSFTYDSNNPLRLSYEIMIKHVNNFELQIDYRNQVKKNTN